MGTRLTRGRGGLAVVAAVLAMLLAAFGMPAGASVGPEGAVADPVVSAATSAQTAPAVAFDGTNFLVVWSDGRDGSIWGARVAPSGQVLGTVAFPIARGPGSHLDPAVAFDGHTFLVVWEARDGGDADIGSVRVSTSGSVLGPVRLLASSAGDEVDPAVASDGVAWLVVWSTPQHPEIVGARVDATGRRGPQLTICDQGHPQAPAVASGPTGSLVVWQDTRMVGHGDVFGARVSTGGAVLDPDGIAIATGGNSRFEPVVARGSSDFLVAWTEVVGVFHTVVTGTRVRPSGVVRDPGGVPYVSTIMTQAHPTISFDGTSWLVGFESGPNDGHDISAVRVGGSGRPVGSVARAVEAPGDQSEPAAAFGGGRHLVVFTDYGRGDVSLESDIDGVRIGTVGGVVDDPAFLISRARNDQGTPAVAFDGTRRLVVWNDDRAGGHAVFGARLRADGTKLDGAGFRISPPGVTGEPAVAFDGAVRSWSLGEPAARPAIRSKTTCSLRGCVPTAPSWTVCRSASHRGRPTSRTRLSPQPLPRGRHSSPSPSTTPTAPTRTCGPTGCVATGRCSTAQASPSSRTSSMGLTSRSTGPTSWSPGRAAPPMTSSWPA